MQPENEMQEKEKALDPSKVEAIVAEEVLDESAKIASGEDSDARKSGGEKSKMSKKQVIGLVVLSLIAVGGVLFGVFGMTSQNEQIAELKGQVSDANDKIAQLETEKVTIEEPDGTEIADPKEISSFQNPIIKASGDSGYDVIYRMPVYVGDANADLYFQTRNGQFYSCQITNAAGSGCNVNNLPDGIYKMATIYEGNGMGGEKIGFLMDDGSVYFASIYDGVDGASLNVNTNFTAKKANISGFVKDIVSINYCSEVSHYCNGSTVFVMNDNSLVKYDESMFE